MVRAKNANENLMAQPQINELVAAMERAKKLPFYYRRKAIREMSGIATHETLINLPKWLVDGSNFHSNIWHVNFLGAHVTASQFTSTLSYPTGHSSRMNNIKIHCTGLKFSCRAKSPSLQQSDSEVAAL